MYMAAIEHVHIPVLPPEVPVSSVLCHVGYTRSKLPDKIVIEARGGISTQTIPGGRLSPEGLDFGILL